MALLETRFDACVCVCATGWVNGGHLGLARASVNGAPFSTADSSQLSAVLNGAAGAQQYPGNPFQRTLTHLGKQCLAIKHEAWAYRHTRGLSAWAS